MEEEREHIANVLGITPAEISETALSYMCHYSADEDRLRQIWETKEWFNDIPDDAPIHDHDEAEYLACLDEEARREDDPRNHLPENLHSLLQDGETWWGLERNAAAAGFYRVGDYLEWRVTNQ